MKEFYNLGPDQRVSKMIVSFFHIDLKYFVFGFFKTRLKKLLYYPATSPDLKNQHKQYKFKINTYLFILT